MNWHFFGFLVSLLFAFIFSALAIISFGRCREMRKDFEPNPYDSFYSDLLIGFVRTVTLMWFILAGTFIISTIILAFNFINV